VVVSSSIFVSLYVDSFNKTFIAVGTQRAFKAAEHAKIGRPGACRKTGVGTALYTVHVVPRFANLLNWRHRACSCFEIYYDIASRPVETIIKCNGFVGVFRLRSESGDTSQLPPKLHTPLMYLLLLALAHSYSPRIIVRHFPSELLVPQQEEDLKC
jgi:hypothetical protein